MPSMSPTPSPSPTWTLEDMRPGATNAVRICMAVQPGERVLILGDQESRLIHQALADAAKEVGAHVTLHELEALAPRPVLEPPAALLDLLARMKPDVSFYTASAQPGELAFRQRYMAALREANPQVRHAHMIGITPLLMVQGMRVDYRRIHQVTMRVHQRVSQARTIRVTNPKGTDLIGTFREDYRWIPCHGLYHEPGSWGNLPEGETFTCPAGLDGILVADELGDYFSERYGVLETPVTFHVEGGRVQQIECPDPDLRDQVASYISGAENADRVGEFAIGTNIALTGLVGNLLQDEKLPGVHVAFGDPYGKYTGADWSSSHHMDVIPVRCTIQVDGEVIMREGQFTAAVMEGID